MKYGGGKDQAKVEDFTYCKKKKKKTGSVKMFISFIYFFTTVSRMLNNCRNAIISNSHDFFTSEKKKGCFSTDNHDYEAKVRKAKP